MPDLSKYKNKLSFKNKLARLIWNITSIFLFRLFPSRIFKRWRRLILVCFGAKMAKSASVHSSAKIWAPWNLIMGENSTISDNVDCYNVSKVIIGDNVTISQRVFLCTASHNIRSSKHELISFPIKIKNNVWVAAESFIGMNVTIGEGAVVGARAAIFKDVDPWNIVGGNPSRTIGLRHIKN